MTRLLSRSIVVAAVALGVAAGAAQAGADTGLPLEPVANVTTPSADPVQMPQAPGSSANEAQAIQQLLHMLATGSAS